MARRLFILAAAVVLCSAADKQSLQLNVAKAEWKPVTLEAIPKGLHQKALHNDPSGKSSSAIIRFPKGYREPRHYHTTCNHIIYVLKGRLKSPDGDLTAGTFLFSAKDERHGPLTAVEETEFFFHVDGAFDYHVDDTAGSPK